ncbi:hypothetical protein CAI21_16810 [Alkalilimnicola ehrlichii]|uniref:Uncharacterized protein n=1 Tax=Alkalilimnicola ehrlichii TaxID=351052 RepID=A0A3E0WI46_9GAMM|nr:tetratricopeptide repeat protein [Alkalilimnicola ehrlichii]RFA26616.1 hypothetical protein CAI21_16810 [Alkalilimnicola ehrlichii]RFA31893.1 hypothetical protein CAL65_21235 [Alkalilimnicola ehrlichii]
MVRLRLLLSSCLLLGWTAVCAAGSDLRDLYFGEALYHAYQGEYFDAIARLDIELGQYYGIDEPQLDTLHFHIRDAEFSVGDFELRYRMHQRAGRAVEAVLEGDVTPSVRNEAAYRLARILFQKGQPVEALQALERISGSVPESIRDDVAYLRAQVYMALGRFDEAIAVLRGLQNSNSYAGFVDYNLGIALFGAGRPTEALVQLARAGQVSGRDPGVLAIRDRSNLVLGTRLMEDEQFDQAWEALDRVRLTGPFSNRALLAAGWADAAAGRYERALVPWTILAERNVTDRAVQEALLAVPFAYGELEVHGKAALLYGKALEEFGNEIARLDASVASIREGKFLEALVREELKQDSDWVLKLRELPETPETYYLVELLASHDFQESLKNYLDLEELRRKTAAWDDYLTAFEELIALRRAYYQPLLPNIDRQFRLLDSRLSLRLEQRDHVARQLHALLTRPRYDFLITASERTMLATLAELEGRLDDDDPASQELLERIRRLQGVVRWNARTEYHTRLTKAFANLRSLDLEIARLKEAYGSFVRTRQAATQSYEGYDETLQRLRVRSREANERIVVLMEQQGALLEVMAIEELESRRRRLEDYQVTARFALADSYDRATIRQGEEAGER